MSSVIGVRKRFIAFKPQGRNKCEYVVHAAGHVDRRLFCDPGGVDTLFRTSGISGGLNKSLKHLPYLMAVIGWEDSWAENQNRSRQSDANHGASRLRSFCAVPKFWPTMVGSKAADAAGRCFLFAISRSPGQFECLVATGRPPSGPA